MCEAYALESHDVTLLCPPWTDPSVGADAFAFARVRRNFKIVRLPRLDPKPGSTGRLSFWIRTFSFLVVARVYLFTHRFDLVVTRDYLALLFSRRWLYEIHIPPKKGRGEALIGRALGLAVLTSGIRDFYTARGFSKERILIAPDAVDPAVFEVNTSRTEVRARWRIPQDAYVVGYVGTLKAMGIEKGIGTVIDALRDTPAGIIACVFGGEKEHIAEYQRRAEAAGVSEKIRFFGQVEHSLVPHIMPAFDCAVVPILDHEVYRLYTSPLKVFEYMAARLPMIVSDLPSLRDVLTEETAVFVPPADGHALAEAILDFQKNPDRALSMSARAKVIVDERYTWRARAHSIIEFAIKMQKNR